MSRRLAHLHCAGRRAVQVWCALLALAFIVGWMAWLPPILAHGSAALAPAAGTDRYVSPSGADSTDCSSPGSPCLHIQFAITSSVAGDIVHVSSGIYTEHITMTNGVSVYGTGWAITQTVISGNFSANQPTVYFPFGIDATTVLSGVQVTHGGTGDPATSPNGGGMNLYFASPQIINSWVYSNTGNFGGGVYVLGGSPTFVNVPAWFNAANANGGGFYFTNDAIVSMSNPVLAGANGTILYNTANYGAGILSTGVTLTLSGLSIGGNVASSAGGGVFIYGPNSMSVQQNNISFNAATIGSGGGVGLSGVTGSIRNNYFIGNQASGNGGGIAAYGSTSGLLIEGNWFESNFISDYGGGIDISSNTATAIINANGFYSNTALSSGAMSLSPSTTGIFTVTNNIVARNIITGAGGTGGVSFGNATGTIANNTIANNNGRGIAFSSANGIQVVNNIVVSNTEGIVRTDSSTYTANYNNVYSNTNNYSGVLTGVNDLATDPRFLRTGNIFSYYHLKSTSPVSKTGSLAYAPPFDIDGDRRAACTSMGADQICSKSLFLPLVLK
jgi:parallel beta-helix repeat protein